MVTELAVIGMAIVTGAVVGGLVTSFYRWVMDRPASFQVRPESFIQQVFEVPVIVFGGPAILMRNAVRGRIIEGRPLVFLGITTFIAGTWSFVCGLVLLQFALAV